MGGVGGGGERETETECVCEGRGGGGGVAPVLYHICFFINFSVTVLLRTQEKKKLYFKGKPCFLSLIHLIRPVRNRQSNVWLIVWVVTLSHCVVNSLGRVGLFRTVWLIVWVV